MHGRNGSIQARALAVPSTAACAHTCCALPPAAWWLHPCSCAANQASRCMRSMRRMASAAAPAAHHRSPRNDRAIGHALVRRQRRHQRLWLPLLAQLLRLLHARPSGHCDPQQHAGRALGALAQAPRPEQLQPSSGQQLPEKVCCPSTHLFSERRLRLALHLVGLLQDQVQDDCQQQPLDHQVALVLEEVGRVPLASRPDHGPEVARKG